MHKKVTVSLPPELAERWNNVVTKHNLVKSVMIQNFLLEIIPKLESEEPHRYINSIVELMAKEREQSLFDDMEHDQSIEDYKKMKIG